MKSWISILPSWCARLFAAKPLDLDHCCNVPPAQAVQHLLVTPHFKDAVDYAKFHRYNWCDCLWAHNEDTLLAHPLPLHAKAFAHYLRDWRKVDVATTARVRARLKVSDFWQKNNQL